MGRSQRINAEKKSTKMNFKKKSEKIGRGGSDQKELDFVKFRCVIKTPFTFLNVDIKQSSEGFVGLVSQQS